MELQIIGWKSCRETRKAERFFKERGISYQFRNLEHKALSAGELNAIMARADPQELINPNSRRYQREGYAYREFDIPEELMEHQDLMRTPIVRWSAGVTVGDDEKTWKGWVKDLTG